MVRLGGAGTALAIAAGMAMTAVASPNNAPSKAVPVTVGVPFSGNWDGTVHAHGETNDHFNHWWKLPGILRPGDVVQVAVDNRAPKNRLDICLVPPVDDFGADDALESCSWEWVDWGSQDRLRVTYGGASGHAYLVPYISECCSGVALADTGQYTITVEQITTRVDAGLVIPERLPRSFALSAQLRYGDNALVADGIGAILQWRYAPRRGVEAADFATLATGTSHGGAVNFSGSLAAAAQGKLVQLRACAAQPGSSSVICSTPGRTTIAAPSAACRTARRSSRRHARVVGSLTTKETKLERKAGRVGKKARRAKRRRAKATYRRRLRKAKRTLRATRRELKTTNRQLARSRQAASKHCP